MNAGRKSNAQSRRDASAPVRRSTPPYNPGLQKLVAGKQARTVPLDDGAKAKLFIAQNDPLKFYHDRAMKLIFKINGQGAPTTVIYGKDGLERARVSGDADWTSPEARALIDKALAGS